MTRVALVGPGAIGATVAAAVRGADVLLYGRSPHERLVVEREGGGTTIVPGPVVTDPAAAAPVDVVLLAVKAHQTEAAAPWLAVLSRPGTIVVALQNCGLLDGVELAGDFVTLAWRKLAINAVAGLMVLSRRRAGMFRRPDVRRLARALASETLAVARAEAARPLEWDARNGVVARLGAEHGLATPVSDVIVPLLAAASGP